MSDGEEDPEASPTAIRYANYFRTGYNAFELLLDFGLYHPDQGRPLMHTRIVTNPAYAKELSRTLRQSLDGYEREHGAIPETEGEGDR
jgi:hypothetical protein